jgi:hypothetical protein
MLPNSYLLWSRTLLDDLRKVGFKLQNGPLDTGIFLMARSRTGGYYLGKFVLT